MNIIEKAAAFALHAHQGQVRKQTDIPYIMHPLEAAVTAQALTDDHEIIAAAVLHDVIEDTDCTKEELEEEFGERIASVVNEVSENKMEHLPSEETWKQRKQETVSRLKASGLPVKTVVLCDKLSNIRAVHRDYQKIGDELWLRFSQKDKNEHGWYYKSVLKELNEFSRTPEYNELRRLIYEVFGEDSLS